MNCSPRRSEMLVREKKLEAAGEIVHLPGRGVVMKDEETESKKTLNCFCLGRT